MKQLKDLVGKNVEVTANGIVYKGVLKDASERAVSILSASGWIEIMMSSISRIEEAGTRTFETRYVDPSFYKNG